MIQVDDRDIAEFERRTRALLEASVACIDGRTRSRLNLARHAALAQLAEARPAFWRSRSWLPIGAAAAAVAVVTLLAWHQRPAHAPRIEGAQSLEDIDLLADGEAFELLQDDGVFYEWAAAEGSASDGSSG